MCRGGVRAGVAYEHLRLAFVTARMACQTGGGYGVLWGASPSYLDIDGTNATTCPACGGAGHVPTPAPSLAGVTG